GVQRRHVDGAALQGGHVWQIAAENAAWKELDDELAAAFLCHEVGELLRADALRVIRLVLEAESNGLFLPARIRAGEQQSRRYQRGTQAHGYRFHVTPWKVG